MIGPGRARLSPDGRARRPGRAGVRGWRGEDGQVTAVGLILLIAILAVIGLSLDPGLALAAKIRASGQAESAARAGAQALDLGFYRATGRVRLVPAQADTAARRWLALVGATGTVTATTDTVTVTVTATQPTQLVGLVGIRALPVHGTASAHPESGVLTVQAGGP